MKRIAATDLGQAVTPEPADESLPMPDPPLNILIVDDEESIRRFVHRVLSEAGYRTTMAVDGADAIAAAAGGGFDLLLTDVVMPHMTGPELAARLRQDHPDLKVLYLTGHSDSLFAKRVTLYDREAFLEKPCSAVGLRQAVSLAITGSVGRTV
jgi:two-component system, cell cycle sensor histidine kinase and response regulator CckA